MADQRISLTDVARLAEVSLAAVSNWKRRYNDFPPSEIRDGREWYDSYQVASWLDSRLVARDGLKGGEPDGMTYGERFRKNANMVNQVVRRDAGDIAQSIYRETYKFRGLMDAGSYSDVVLALFYIRTRFPSDWRLLLKGRPGAALRSRVSVQVPEQVFDILAGVNGRKILLQFADMYDRLLGSDFKSAGSDSGQVFTELLSLYSTEMKFGLEFFTPSNVARLMAELTLPSAGERILDPCCGTGGLLVEAAKHLQKKNHWSSSVTISGKALNERSRWLSSVNLDLHRISAEIDSVPGIAISDGACARSQFDVVLSNPPFNLRHAEYGVYDWPYGPPPPHNANFAWLQYAVSSLARGGRASVLMADNSSSSADGRESTIRQEMVHRGVVEAVIALPSRLFSGTGISVTLWRLRNPEDEIPPPSVLFIDARSLGEMVDRTRRVLSYSDISRVVESYRTWRDGGMVAGYNDEPGFSAAAGIETIRLNGYRLMPGAYVGLSRSDDVSVPENKDAAIVSARELYGELSQLEGKVAESDRLVDEILRGIFLWNH